MPSSDWEAQISDIGSILRARTKDVNGKELGTFTADTRPTGEEVTNLILTATGDIVDEHGANLPPDLWPQARRLSALGTAMLVELSYFPEQVATGRSPYEQLKALYDAAWERLAENLADEDPEDEIGEAHLPRFGFPENRGGVVDWSTTF